MIKPTIGRQVWYWPHHENEVFTRNRQPQAATVCYVHNDWMVNLQVIDHDGIARAETRVPLRQPEDKSPVGPYCEWMPYQKGQAAKLEQLESAVAAANVHAMDTGSAS